MVKPLLSMSKGVSQEGLCSGWEWGAASVVSPPQLGGFWGCTWVQGCPFSSLTGGLFRGRGGRSPLRRCAHSRGGGFWSSLYWLVRLWPSTLQGHVWQGAWAVGTAFLPHPTLTCRLFGSPFPLSAPLTVGLSQVPCYHGAPCDWVGSGSGLLGDVLEAEPLCHFSLRQLCWWS